MGGRQDGSRVGDLISSGPLNVAGYLSNYSNTQTFNLGCKKIYLDLYKQKNGYFLQDRRCGTLNLGGKYWKINGGGREPPQTGHGKVI